MGTIAKLYKFGVNIKKPGLNWQLICILLAIATECN